MRMALVSDPHSVRRPFRGAVSFGTAAGVRLGGRFALNVARRIRLDS